MGTDHVRDLALQRWFAAAGAPNGQFVGDPEDSRKQVETLAAFEAWWDARQRSTSDPGDEDRRER
jgi:hypothetical protein